MSWMGSVSVPTTVELIWIPLMGEACEGPLVEVSEGAALYAVSMLGRGPRI